jgi:hypothetical protein
MQFEYGRTIALGTFTPWLGGWLRTGDAISYRITGLAANTIYYFRAIARNAIGTSYGSIIFFINTKGAPASIEILATTGITEHHAQLNGVVINDADRPGAVRFQYGATTDYGMVTPWQQGFATGDEFHAVIEGLSEGCVYHFRAEFQHSPPVYSKDGSFSTLSALGGLTLIDESLLYQLEA